MTDKEVVNQPSHYTQGKIEVIDFIEDQNLGFHLGNVLKYVCRSGHKNGYVEDLQKARWYLSREIERAEAEEFQKSLENVKGAAERKQCPCGQHHKQGECSWDLNPAAKMTVEEFNRRIDQPMKGIGEKNYPTAWPDHQPRGHV